MTRIVLVSAVLAILAPVAGADALAFAPSEVVATPSGLVAIVAWAPGNTVADSYRVYGLIPGQDPTLLLDTAATAAPVTFAALVSGDFSAYAVSGVLAGQESPMVEASGPPCIFIETTPHPNVSLHCLRGELFNYRRPV